VWTTGHFCIFVGFCVPGPDGPLYADFRALRHSYLTLGGLAGIDLRTLQELAGHSTPTLTARYSRRWLYDLAAPSKSSLISSRRLRARLHRCGQLERMEQAHHRQFRLPELDPLGGISRHRTAIENDPDAEKARERESLQNTPPDSRLHPEASSC